MPSQQHPDPAAKNRPAAAPRRDDQPDGKSDKDAREEEVLRDQSKTEVEERPYLDTQGGE